MLLDYLKLPEACRPAQISELLVGGAATEQYGRLGYPFNDCIELKEL
jgi:hypothetical protein